VLAAACALTPALAGAQALERSAYVSVLDARGQPVEAVSLGDVVVREDGTVREVLRVVPATEPMQIAVLVDTSAALGSDVVNVREALEAFVTRMAAGNAVALIEFGDRPRILVDSTSDPRALVKGVGQVFSRAGSGAYLLEAIVETSRGFQKRESPRPVMVVVMTEGVEFGNYGHEQTLEALAAGGAALHVAVLVTPGGGDDSSFEVRTRNVVVDRGTRDSGGRRENLLSSMALASTLDALASELLRQVEVVYARPRTLIPPSKITIEAGRPGITVRGTPARPAKG
jgi:hypothetical protein